MRLCRLMFARFSMLEPEDTLSDFIHEVCLYIFRNHGALSGTVNDLLLSPDDVGRRPDNVVEDRGLSITGMMFETQIVAFESLNPGNDRRIAVRLIDYLDRLTHLGWARPDNDPETKALVGRTARMLIGKSL